MLKIPRAIDLIGNTKLVDLSAMANPKVEGVKIYGKMEFQNPGYSMKDRIIKEIFDEAAASGKLQPGQTVVCASSGNTGASCAMISAMRGYHAMIITNRKCSKEKQDAIKAYGAELVVVQDGVNYMDEEQRLATENPNWFSVNQYENPLNSRAHYNTTGNEIWNQTQGTVTDFVAGGSTGGTITGVGTLLKEKSENIKITLADPIGSIFYKYFHEKEVGTPQKFLVEGVGKGNIPGVINFDVMDDVIRVTDQEAFQTCYDLARKEGLCVGGSSGMNVAAAVKIANEATEPRVIVTILCDSGLKYLSKIFNQDYCEKNGIKIKKTN